jgi:hypothetical protein
MQPMLRFPCSSRNPTFDRDRGTTTSLPKLTKCLTQSLRGSNLTMLYVATDAPKWELEEMGKMLSGSGVYIASLPPWQEWDRHHWARWLPQNSQVDAFLRPLVFVHLRVLGFYKRRKMETKVETMGRRSWQEASYIWRFYRLASMELAPVGTLQMIFL